MLRAVTKTLLGPHRELLKILPERAAHSFAAQREQSVAVWRRKARALLTDRLCLPERRASAVRVRVESRNVSDGLLVEHLSWAMPWGPPARAVFVRPEGAKRRLPAVLGLHDHSGFKAMGHEKIAAVTPAIHPRLQRHYTEYYEGRPWVTELAKRGFAVLAHDGFMFGSRRLGGHTLHNGAFVRFGHPPVPRSSATIDAYDEWANRYEDVLARSIFAAGATVPGVCLREDQIALDVLTARRDVDPRRIGCCGLSGGGLRSVFLAGLDDRIAASVTVGFMSTWRDFAAYHSYAHTWMLYVPGLPPLLDFPDILSLRMPAPTLVQSAREDPLFSLTEMQRAHRRLREAFGHAGAADALVERFYPGGHRFSITMQEDAFRWLGERLGEPWCGPASRGAQRKVKGRAPHRAR
jgi:dienelactone hydrolase